MMVFIEIVLAVIIGNILWDKGMDLLDDLKEESTVQVTNIANLAGPSVGSGSVESMVDAVARLRKKIEKIDSGTMRERIYVALTDAVSIASLGSVYSIEKGVDTVLANQAAGQKEKAV